MDVFVVVRDQNPVSTAMFFHTFPSSHYYFITEFCQNCVQNGNNAAMPRRSPIGL